jgi:hypothetical protein
MAKTTTITIETNSLLLIRASGSMHAWCPGCGMEVEVIRLSDLGALSDLEDAAIEQLLKSGVMHRPEGADGSSAICLNSLLAHQVGEKSAERGLAQAYKETK